MEDWPEVVSFGSPTEEFLNEKIVPLNLRPAIINRLVATTEKLKQSNIEQNQKSNAVNAVQSIIENLNLSKNVFVHPIKFINPGEVISNRTKWNKRIGLVPSVKSIGLFGFISKYKGFETAFKALEQLPSNFILIIAGRQHPTSINEHEDIDNYLLSLLNVG